MGYNRIRNMIHTASDTLATVSGNLNDIILYQSKTPLVIGANYTLGATSARTVYCTQSAHMTVSLPVATRVRSYYNEPLEFIIKDAVFSGSTYQIRVTSSNTAPANLHIDNAFRSFTIKENGGFIHIRWDPTLVGWFVIEQSGSIGKMKVDGPWDGT